MGYIELQEFALDFVNFLGKEKATLTGSPLGPRLITPGVWKERKWN